MNKKIAFVGTGPVSLLKGYFLGKHNPESEIVFFDSRDQIGGAWYSEKSPGNVEIECGCHIWSYVPEVYDYIQQELNIALYPYRPNAVFVGKNYKLPYSLKNSIDTYTYFFKNIFLGRFGKIRSMKENPYMQFSLIGKKNLYPKTGSPELFKAIKKKIDSLQNVQIRTNFEVEQVHADGNKITLNKDKELCFDEVYMTSVSHLKKISNDDKEILIDPQQVDYIHLLAELNKPLKRKVSYWRMMNDPVIHRITDISYQTGNKENLLLAGIKPNAFTDKSEDELETYLADLLRKHKLIDSSHDVKRIRTHVYPTYYIEQNVRREIDELHPNLHLLHSTDLMHGFYFLLKEEGLIT